MIISDSKKLVAHFCRDLVTNFPRKNSEVPQRKGGFFPIQKNRGRGVGGQRLFGVFPKIHPNLVAQASLREGVQQKHASFLD